MYRTTFSCQILNCSNFLKGSLNIFKISGCPSKFHVFRTPISHSFQITQEQWLYGQTHYKLEYSILLRYIVASCPPKTNINFKCAKELTIITLFFGKVFFRKPAELISSRCVKNFAPSMYTYCKMQVKCCYWKRTGCHGTGKRLW